MSLAVGLAEGATPSWVTVTRTGSFTDPRYGRFEITLAMLEQMGSNFDGRVFGQDVFIDVAHKPSDGAAGKVMRLAVEGTRRGAELKDFLLCAPVMLAGEDVPVQTLQGKVVRNQLSLA
ncbi:hypothetical protein [Roseateles sp. P5_E1]